MRLTGRHRLGPRSLATTGPSRWSLVDRRFAEIPPVVRQEATRHSSVTACLPLSDHLARLATARTAEHADSDVSDPEQRQLVCFPDPAHTEKASSVSDRCPIRNVQRNRHDAGVDWDADRKKFHRPLPILSPIRRVFTATWTITHSLTLSHLAR